jgi:ribonuclease Y
MLTVVAALIGIAAGAIGLWVWLRTVSTSRLRLAEDQRRALLADAERESETARREAQIEAREHAIQLRADLEREIQESRVQMAKAEARAQQRESELEAKSEEFARREQGIADRELHTKQLQEQLKAGNEEMLRELERVGGLTLGEARSHLLERSEDLVRHELARTVRQLDEEARSDAKRKARALVADALQRVAASHTAETTVSVVESSPE